MWRTSASALISGLGLIMAGGLEARELADERYQVIVDRNPFGLKPPAPAVVAPPVATNPPPVQVNVNLTGITSFGGRKKAWLVVPPIAGKNTNSLYLTLAEGDPEEGGIQVLEIDDQAQRVKILNAGAPATLDFENNGMALKATVAAVATPGTRTIPGRPTVTAPRPTVRTAVPTPRPATSRIQTLPRPTATTAARLPGQSSTLQTIPARNIRTASPALDPQDQRAIQLIQAKVNEAAARAQGLSYPPLPPIRGLDQ